MKKGAFTFIFLFTIFSFHAQITYIRVGDLSGDWNSTDAWTSLENPAQNVDEPPENSIAVLLNDANITIPAGVTTNLLEGISIGSPTPISTFGPGDANLTVNGSLRLKDGGDIKFNIITLATIGSIRISTSNSDLQVGATGTIEYTGDIDNFGTMNVNGTVNQVPPAK